MARAKLAESSLRSLALHPLRNFKHEPISVSEWDACVTVRALSADDWLGYRQRSQDLLGEARLKAGLEPRSAKTPSDEPADPEQEVEYNATPLFAFVLVRTLFDASNERVFDDADVDEVAQAFSPVHDRLVAKAFELSGIDAAAGGTDPVAKAGND